MNNRVTSDSANSVSLFPFLAVLLCTMGALLVLLVVLAQRAGERVLAESVGPANVAEAAPQPPPIDNSNDATELLDQLEKVRAYKVQLLELRQQAEQRLRDERTRLSHLEHHTRRLEHELARLALAAQQLSATENEQSVDQAQAERELSRLQQLLVDTENELEALRKQPQGQQAYAILPYKGPNGTHRKPIYIECRGDAIILHPEGIRLKPSDFYATSWPGNPLAAALRATRDHINTQAAKAGAPEPPDPYPMILVRPDGIPQYSLVRAAISSWDATFGYEFIDQDWQLDFPEAPDPLVAREQEHAIMLARDRLARLIRSAPRRFQGVALGGSESDARGGTDGSNGYGEGNSTGEFNSEWQLAQSDQGGAGDGKGSAAHAGESSHSSAESSGQTDNQYGSLAGSGTGSAEGEGTEELAADSASSQGAEAGTGEVASERTAQTGGAAEGTASSQGSFATTGGAESSGGDNARGSASGGSTSGGGSSSSSSGGGGSSGASQPSSIADARGRNWAVQSGGQSSVPIRRPIQVVVREDQLALLPSRHTLAGEANSGTTISLNQSMEQISDEFVTALRTRVEQWGLAGNGLYWRPVLNLNVGPGAEQAAEQVLRLLEDSGVEVSTAETALAPQERTNNATR